MAVLSRLLARSAAMAAETLADFRRPARALPRLVDEGETLCSVLLAILFAHLLHAQNVGWAAFSGYMVMRSTLADSCMRGLLRSLGTLLGAGAAYAAVERFGAAPLPVALAIALVGSLALYGALTRWASYAWLFTGITFAMVALDALQQPHAELLQFVRTRIVEVLSGVVACLLVSVLSLYSVRRWLAARLVEPSPPAPPAARPEHWRRLVVGHALQAGIALALLPLLARWLSVDNLSQAAVTVMAVMVVPLPALLSRRDPVAVRNLQRMLGCSLGALLAALGLWLCAGNAAAVLTAMSLGVLAGRHVENSGRSYAYVGTQFALVYLVVTVPDSYRGISVEPGLQRLLGILAGFLLVQGVRAAWHAAAWTLRRRCPACAGAD